MCTVYCLVTAIAYAFDFLIEIQAAVEWVCLAWHGLVLSSLPLGLGLFIVVIHSYHVATELDSWFSCYFAH